MPTVANLTMKSMIVKHGTLVSGSSVGKGELASAMEGLNLITGILLPPVSGALYNLFLHPPAGACIRSIYLSGYDRGRSHSFPTSLPEMRWLCCCAGAPGAHTLSGH